jgi:hypothetical protein
MYRGPAKQEAFSRSTSFEHSASQASSRITMDIYAQAQMPAKRAARQKGGGDGAGGKTSERGQKDGLTAPQNAPWRK